jgi:hypothetical protein
VREEVAKLRKENFYSKNPDLNTPEYRDIIERLGGNPEEVINMPTFKAIYEKAKGFDESQKLRTVLESNPRTVATKDRLSKARTAVQQGNYAQAKELAIDAVVSQMLK